MQKIKSIHILALLVVILAIASLFTFLSNKGEVVVTARDWPEIQEANKLIVVMEYTPESYMRKGDTIIGEQYRLVNALSEWLNIPVEIRLENDLQKSINGLVRCEYDLVARLLPITSEMRNYVSFTDPLTRDKQVLIQRVQGDTTARYIASQLELPGKKIVVTQNSPYIQRLQNLAQEIASDSILIEQMPDYNEEQLAILVAGGEIDYAVCDYETAQRCALTYPNLDISVNISFSQLQAWAVRKNAPILCDTINAWMKTLSKNKKR